MAEPEYIQPSLFELASEAPLDEVEDESVLLQPAAELEAEPTDGLLEDWLDEDSAQVFKGG